MIQIGHAKRQSFAIIWHHGPGEVKTVLYLFRILGGADPFTLVTDKNNQETGI
jgi:hypothetical protein